MFDYLLPKHTTKLSLLLLVQDSLTAEGKASAFNVIHSHSYAMGLTLFYVLCYYVCVYVGYHSKLSLRGEALRVLYRVSANLSNEEFSR